MSLYLLYPFSHTHGSPVENGCISFSNVGIVTTYLTQMQPHHFSLNHDFWLKTRVRQAGIWSLFWDLTILTCFFVLFRLVRNLCLGVYVKKPITDPWEEHLPTFLYPIKNQPSKCDGLHIFFIPGLSPMETSLWIFSGPTLLAFMVSFLWVQQALAKIFTFKLLGYESTGVKVWGEGWELEGVFLGAPKEILMFFLKFLVLWQVFCCSGILGWESGSRWFKQVFHLFFVTRFFSCFFFAVCFCFRNAFIFARYLLVKRHLNLEFFQIPGFVIVDL